jgi:hypothetical protein
MPYPNMALAQACDFPAGGDWDLVLPAFHANIYLTRQLRHIRDEWNRVGNPDVCWRPSDVCDPMMAIIDNQQESVSPSVNWRPSALKIIGESDPATPLKHRLSQRLEARYLSTEIRAYEPFLQYGVSDKNMSEMEAGEKHDQIQRAILAMMKSITIFNRSNVSDRVHTLIG